MALPLVALALPTREKNAVHRALSGQERRNYTPEKRNYLHKKEYDLSRSPNTGVKVAEMKDSEIHRAINVRSKRSEDPAAVKKTQDPQISKKNTNENVESAEEAANTSAFSAEDSWKANLAKAFILSGGTQHVPRTPGAGYTR